MEIVRQTKRADGSIDTELSNGAIGNHDNNKQALSWARQCGWKPEYTTDEYGFIN